MDDENQKRLSYYTIHELRKLARDYNIVPSTKKKSQLIEEISYCERNNLILEKSTRGRKPKKSIAESTVIEKQNREVFSQIAETLQKIVDAQEKNLQIVKEDVARQEQALQELRNVIKSILD